MFQVEEVNCICVDWSRGSRTAYTQAVHNIRVVGAEIALLVQVLSVKPCLSQVLGARGAELGQGSTPSRAWVVLTERELGSSQVARLKCPS